MTADPAMILPSMFALGQTAVAQRVDTPRACFAASTWVQVFVVVVSIYTIACELNRLQISSAFASRAAATVGEAEKSGARIIEGIT